MIHLSCTLDAYGIWSWALYRDDAPICAQGGFDSEDSARNGFRTCATAVGGDADRVQKLAFEAKVFGPDGKERNRESETTHEVKAKNLRVGYGVWAEGTSSRIHKVSRHHPDNPGQVVAFTAWGRIAYDPDELVKVSAPVLHPRIVDDKNQEIGVGSMIKGGDSDAGELVEFTEPDESHWGVLVKWPEFDDPERFEASPNDPSEDPLYCTDVEAI